MQSEAIWIIDPDDDDRQLAWEISKELALLDEFVFLRNAEETLDLMSKVESAPFIIICELNLHKTNGFELRKQLLESNSKKFKSVPFIYWSTFASEAQITHAYELAVHGFFIKEPSLDEMKKTFIEIINYWKKSRMPSKQEQ